MADWGGQTMVDRLRRVVVRTPGEAFGAADPERWHYGSRPDLEAARAEHRAFVAILEEAGAEVVEHDEALPGHADAIFVHDPLIVIDRGYVQLRMGKELRRGEEAALARTLTRAGVPCAGRIEAPGVVEGGDLLWVTPKLLAVGLGFRTDRAGFDQLGALVEPDGVECLPVELPWWTGPDACLHLMSLISMVDHDLAVAHERLLPVSFLQRLASEGVAVVSVPESELASQGPNVLALAPRDCLLLEENRITAERLAAAGCRVRTYRGREISHKAEGGATCLTRAVLRRG